MWLARLCRFGPLVLAFLLLAFAVRDLAPSGTLGVTDETVASARRHLEVIAAEPHPSGSAANVAARTYLHEQLEALGLEVRVDTWNRGALELTNLAVRFAGTDATGAVLVLAHHDSVSRGPGAADDGTGCVAILELARALEGGPPLRQDVILLLTDGEEQGLYGAFRFRDSDPWMQDVRAVINLEAMGGAGPLVCFQMSNDNADLVNAWRSSPQPVGSSFAEVVYSLMPNDSDLSVFLGEVPGMNFALVGGCSVYHQPYDVPGKVEDRAMRHEIATLTSCVRTLASGEWREDAPARNWFAWPFLGTVEWSVSPPEWGILSILGLLLVLDAPGARGRRMLAILRGILTSSLSLIVFIAPAFAIGYAFLFTRSGGKGPTSYAEVHTMLALQGAWMLLVLAGIAAWSGRSPRRAAWVLEASLGALLVASLGGVYYHVQGLGLRGSDGLPLRAAVTAAAVAFVLAQRTKGTLRWIVLIPLVYVALTFAPFVSILPQIGSQLEWLAAAQGAVLFAAFALLVSPLIVEHVADAREDAAASAD